MDRPRFASRSDLTSRRGGGRRHPAGGMFFPMQRHVIAGLFTGAVRG